MLRAFAASAILLSFCMSAQSEGSGWFPDRSWWGGRPRAFVGGRLKCAANVNTALAERGITGSGSHLAKSFLTWGRASGPVPGAVAVYDRGGFKGHAAIVSRVNALGQVCIHNPGKRGWREVCGTRQAIAYRVP